MDTTETMAAEKTADTTMNDKFNVVLNVNGINSVPKNEFSIEVDASFEFNGKTFYVKPCMMLYSSYGMRKAKSEEEMYSAFLKDIRGMYKDKTMEAMTSLINFDIGDLKTNGIYDHFKKFAEKERDAIKVKLTEELTRKWNESKLVKNKATIEKYGGKLNHENCESFVKEGLYNTYDRVYATFSKPNPVVDGGELCVYVDQNENVKTERYNVRANFGCDGRKNIKIETAIDSALDMIQSKIASLKKLNGDKSTYDNCVSAFKKTLEDAGISCEIDAYFDNHGAYKTALYSKTVGVSLIAYSGINFSEFSFNSISGKRDSRYGIDSISFTVGEVIDIFNGLRGVVETKTRKYNEKVNADIRGN